MTLIFCETPIPWILDHLRSVGAKASTSLDHLDAWKTPNPGSWILNARKKMILDPGPGAKAPISHDDLDYLKNPDPWILDHLYTLGGG